MFEGSLEVVVVVGWRIGIVEVGLALEHEPLPVENHLEVDEEEGGRLVPIKVSPLIPLSLSLSLSLLALGTSR